LKYAAGRGKPWLSFSEVIAANVESVGTKAYTPAELRMLFGAFGYVDIVCCLTPYDIAVGGPVARLAGNRLGWFAGVVARLPH